MSSPTAHPVDVVPAPLGQRRVAIPRLQRTDQRPDTVKNRRRVPRACTAVSELRQCEMLDIEVVIHFPDVTCPQSTDN
jgi:hypothetical protein